MCTGSILGLVWFPQTSDIIALMAKTCPLELAAELDRLKHCPDASGLKRFYTDLMTMDSQRQGKVVAESCA